MLDTNALAERIKKHSAKRIFFQAPEGLKMQIQDISKELEKDSIEVLVSIDPCYGACDMRDHEAKLLGCDLIVHIGHTDFGLKTELPVIYEELRIDADIISILEENLNLLEGETIGLVTTLQYLDSLAEAKIFLESKGKKILLGKPGRAKYAAQVLGCDYSGPKSVENDVDLFLFMGTGMFHPLEFAMQTEKPVLFLDIENKTVKNMSSEKERIQRIRFAQLEKAKDCENFGIFVSTKPGQMSIERATKAKDALERKGKKAWVIVANDITPTKLLGLRIDCLVNCACPRIREDSEQFRIPIINAEDVEKF